MMDKRLFHSQRSKNYKVAWMLLCSLVFIAACIEPKEEVAVDDTLLAKVHNQSLYLSDLDGMIPDGETAQDSTLLLNALVEDWVRSTLLLHEAERNIPTDVNIDELVRDYRSTLVRHNFEQQLIESNLDSTITEAEIQAFYDQNKDEYQLTEPIIRCRFLKVPLTAPTVDDISLWWKSEAEIDEIQLVNYCDKYAEIYYLNEEKWFELDKIAKHLPANTLTKNNVNFQKNVQKKDENYFYLLEILEIVSNNEPLPLGYIENRAKKVILHQRKIKLIEDKKAALYKEGTDNNHVQFFNR